MGRQETTDAASFARYSTTAVASSIFSGSLFVYPAAAIGLGPSFAADAILLGALLLVGIPGVLVFAAWASTRSLKRPSRKGAVVVGKQEPIVAEPANDVVEERSAA